MCSGWRDGPFVAMSGEGADLLCKHCILNKKCRVSVYKLKLNRLLTYTGLMRPKAFASQNLSNLA